MCEEGIRFLREARNNSVNEHRTIIVKHVTTDISSHSWTSGVNKRSAFTLRVAQNASSGANGNTHIIHTVRTTLNDIIKHEYINLSFSSPFIDKSQSNEAPSHCESHITLAVAQTVKRIIHIETTTQNETRATYDSRHHVTTSSIDIGQSYEAPSHCESHKTLAVVKSVRRKVSIIIISSTSSRWQMNPGHPIKSSLIPMSIKRTH